MTFVSFFASMMVMLAEEPENRDNCAAKKYEEHLSPLVASLVELCRDDLTAGDVDKSTTRKAQENDVNHCVALRKRHAN